MTKDPGAGDAGEGKGRQEATSQRAWGRSATGAFTPGRRKLPGEAPCWQRGSAGQGPAGLLPQPTAAGRGTHGEAPVR